MKNLELTEREITYLLLSLKKYEAQLLESSDEDMEDTATDLIFIQSLQEKLKQLQETA